MTHSEYPSLFEYTANQPYPLLAAEKWDFQLDYYDVDGKPENYLYHAVQWTIGLGASDHTTWERTKTQDIFSTHNLKIEQLPYISTDNKEYMVDYINQQACYHVAMSMRVTKNRPQLQDIRDYLAKSGAFVDWAKRNPEQAIKNLSAYAREKELDKLERAGYSEHPHARWLDARNQNIATLKKLRDTMKDIIDNPNFPILENERYLAFFNATAGELKEILKTKSVRDALGVTQLRTITFAEDTLKDVISTHKHLTHAQAVTLTRQILPPIADMLKELMNAQGLDHVTGQPLLGKGE